MKNCNTPLTFDSVTMQTRFITTDEELITLKEDWDRLVTSRPETDMPFYSWDWFYRSWIHFGKPEGRKLFVVAVYESERLVGILPLVSGERKSSGIAYRILCFCNTGMMPRNTMYTDSRQNQEAVFRAAWKHLFEHRSLWDMLEFANVIDSSPFHRFVLEGEHDAGFAMIQTQGLTSPFLELSDSVEDYLAGIDKKVRYNIKRYVKLFETNDKQHTVRVFQHPHESEEALRLAGEVKEASWKGGTRDAPFFRFFNDALPVLFANREALIQIILLENVPIAASFRLTRNGVFYGFGTDYKQEYKEHSPGVLLFYYLLHHIIEHGGHAFDFCGGDYNYKKQYTDIVQNHSSFQIFHSGMKSRFVYWSKTFLLPLIRKILRKPADGDFISKRSG